MKTKRTKSMILALLIALCVALGAFTACGSEEKPQSGGNNSQNNNENNKKEDDSKENEKPQEDPHPDDHGCGCEFHCHCGNDAGSCDCDEEEPEDDHGHSHEEDVTYSIEGLIITLPGDFIQEELQGQTAYFESNEAIAVILKEEFTTFEAIGISTDMSLVEYAELLMELYGHEGDIYELEGLIFFEYEATITGTDFSYFATVFRGDDAYWMVQFACLSDDYDELCEEFVEWALTVEV